MWEKSTTTFALYANLWQISKTIAKYIVNSWVRDCLQTKVLILPNNSHCLISPPGKDFCWENCCFSPNPSCTSLWLERDRPTLVATSCCSASSTCSCASASRIEQAVWWKKGYFLGQEEAVERWRAGGSVLLLLQQPEWNWRGGEGSVEGWMQGWPQDWQQGSRWGCSRHWKRQIQLQIQIQIQIYHLAAAARSAARESW